MLLFWLFVCYTWIFTYMLAIILAVYIWRLEKQRTKYLLEMIREIGWEQISGEILQHPSQLGDRAEALGFVEDYGILCFSRGLTRSEALLLPKKSILPSDLYKGNTRCMVCLQEFAVGDKACELPNCHHIFHMLCIEAWLFREAECPNCGGVVEVPVPNRDDSGEGNDTREFLVEPLLAGRHAFM
ncbi:MAG: RING finger domain-containing protein [Candidatus Pacebacteria bacterium]|nr:RING finger domain-containing protein [Candidatus Paceibacterota bacterium]